MPQVNDTVVAEEEPVKNASFGKVSNTNYLKDSNFTVSVKHENNTPISNKTVYFTVDGGEIINSTTDEKGNANLLLNFDKGTHTVKYVFNETGFNPISSSSKILLMTTGFQRYRHQHTRHIKDLPMSIR